MCKLCCQKSTFWPSVQKLLMAVSTFNFHAHLINITVLFTDPPVITVTPSASLLHVAINSSLSLTCNVLSEPVSNVTWKKNNLQVRNGKSTSPLVLVLGRLQHSDTAGYSCTAVNSEGQKYIIKQVVVQGKRLLSISIPNENLFDLRMNHFKCSKGN